MLCREQSHISKGQTGEAVSFFPTLIGLRFTNDSSLVKRPMDPPRFCLLVCIKTRYTTDREQVLPVLHAYLSPCHYWSRMQRSLFAWGCTFQLMVRVTNYNFCLHFAKQQSSFVMFLWDSVCLKAMPRWRKQAVIKIYWDTWGNSGSVYIHCLHS